MRDFRLPCVLALFLSACGGGGGGGGTPAGTSISGTAATGAPVANAAVDVKCRQGTATGTTDAAGKFDIPLTSAQAPCMLQVASPDGALVSLTSAAGGTANITSLTHLLAARLLGSASPAGAFAAADDATFAAITTQDISAAQGSVASEILRIGAQMPTVNWVTQPFTATPGDAMDGALELLKDKLATQNKSLAAAAIELSTGPLQVVVPPEGGVSCVPGMIAGFDKAVQDELTRVVSRPNADGGGDGPGGIGGEGAGGVGVGGSLGQFVNVDVTVQFASGAAFGPVRADTSNGMVTLVPCDLQPPVLVTLTGAPGSGATYFDEHLVLPVQFEGQTLRGVLNRLDRNGGVTPFTEAMVRRALFLGNEVATAGGRPLKAVEKAEDAWKDPARVQIAHDEVLAAVNDLLPGIYRLEDLTRLPVMVSQANSQANSGVLTDNQNGVYGAVLGGLAKAAGQSQPGSAAPALAIQQQIANDLEDGVLNLRRDQTPVSADIGAGTYQYDSLAARVTNETGALAKSLGAGNLKTATVPVQRLRAKSGVDFDATPNWIFTLLSDGGLRIVRNGGPELPVPALPSGARFSRIDIFDRSTRTIGDSPDLWQNCFVATAMDGQSLLTWRVGMSGGFVARDVNKPGDPVVGIMPESLSAEINGGDSILFVRRSGETGTTDGCDVQDFHPGIAQAAAGRYVVQAFQDFGNRYLVYSDGTVQGWGINRGALGVGLDGDESLGPDDKAFVRPEAGAGAALTGVAMLSRGQDIQQTRALLRTPDAGRDGRVVVWGTGLPSPRVIPGLEDTCWISGPYAVACNGQLRHAIVTVQPGGNITAVVTPVAGVSPIWRVNADRPTARVAVDDPDEEDDTIRQVTSLTLGHVAIAVDGTIYQLDGTTAIEQQ